MLAVSWKVRTFAADYMWTLGSRVPILVEIRSVMLFLASWEPENFSNCIGNAARSPTRRLKRKIWTWCTRNYCGEHVYLICSFRASQGLQLEDVDILFHASAFSIRLPPFNPTVGVTSKSNGGASLSGIPLVSTLLDVHTSIFYIWVYSNAHVVKRRRFQRTWMGVARHHDDKYI